jgi:hypothetical protein
LSTTSTRLQDLEARTPVILPVGSACSRQPALSDPTSGGLVLALYEGSHRSILLSVLLLFASSLFLLAFTPGPSPQTHGMEGMPGMQDAPALGHDTAAMSAKRAADKRESEFNHRFAGLLLVLAGMLVLAHVSFAKASRVARYTWPFCFFAAGLFLLVFSDTEIWPFGPQSPWYAVTHNPEDLQHKLFALILLLLGFVELQRVLGKLKAPWSAWVFPLVGLAGSVMLLFHTHSAGMHGPNHMAVMKHIQAEHRWYAAVGVGIVTAKVISDARNRWKEVFAKIWPLLLMVLGVSLMLYTE